MKKLTKKEIAWNKGYEKGYNDGLTDAMGKCIAQLIKSCLGDAHISLLKDKSKVEGVILRKMCLDLQTDEKVKLVDALNYDLNTIWNFMIRKSNEKE